MENVMVSFVVTVPAMVVESELGFHKRITALDLIKMLLGQAQFCFENTCGINIDPILDQSRMDSDPTRSGNSKKAS